jgi:hypothetical protein
MPRPDPSPASGVSAWAASPMTTAPGTHQGLQPCTSSASQ